MAEPKLYRIMLSIIFMSLIVTGLMIFISGGADTYGITTYDNTSLMQLNSSFNEINDITQETQQKLENFSTSDVTDRLGLIFQQGYSAVRVVGTSVSTLFTVTEVGVDELAPVDASGYSKTVITMLTAAILVIIVVGLLLAFVIKSDRV